MWRIVILFVLVCGACAPPAHATSQMSGQPYRIDASGRFVTAVMIDGKGPFSFVLDTAASRTLLYDHVQAQLGLPPSQPGDITVYGINTTASALPVKPGVLTVAGAQVTGLTLGVLPHVEVNTPGVDGILGIDVLARYMLVLDRANMRFLLLDPDGKDAGDFRKWAGISLKPRPLRNIPIDFWYMTAEFGAVRLNALLDLGTGISMLNWPAAERLGVHKKDYHTPEALSVALRDLLGTDEPVVKITGLTVSLNRQSWRNRTLVVANSDIFTHFNLDEEPAAILGADLLGDNSIAVDFAHHRLYIGDRFSAKPRAD